MGADLLEARRVAVLCDEGAQEVENLALAARERPASGGHDWRSSLGEKGAKVNGARRRRLTLPGRGIHCAHRTLAVDAVDCQTRSGVRRARQISKRHGRLCA